jgi:hypothetical protein
MGLVILVGEVLEAAILSPSLLLLVLTDPEEDERDD